MLYHFKNWKTTLMLNKTHTVGRFTTRSTSAANSTLYMCCNIYMYSWNHSFQYICHQFKLNCYASVQKNRHQAFPSSIRISTSLPTHSLKYLCIFIHSQDPKIDTKHFRTQKQKYIHVTGDCFNHSSRKQETTQATRIPSQPS